MLRSASKLQRAQREHVACRIRIHANQPATAWADTPTAIIIIIIILSNTKGYISILFTRPRGKRTTCDCRLGEGDPSVQLYSGSVLVAHVDGTFSQRSCDAQY